MLTRKVREEGGRELASALLEERGVHQGVRGNVADEERAIKGADDCVASVNGAGGQDASGVAAAVDHGDRGPDQAGGRGAVHRDNREGAAGGGLVVGLAEGDRRALVLLVAGELGHEDEDNGGQNDGDGDHQDDADNGADGVVSRLVGLVCFHGNEFLPCYRVRRLEFQELYKSCCLISYGE